MSETKEVAPQFDEGMKVPVKEACLGGVTQRDLSDTSDAMWKVRNSINEMMNDMTLDECVKMSESMTEMKKTMRMPAGA
jgi:hypothetical protein